MSEDRARVERARRKLRSMGYQLVTKDGEYAIADPQYNTIVTGTEGVGRPHWNIDDIENWIQSDSEEVQG